MTSSQQRAIERLKKQAEDYAGSHMEIKDINITDEGFFVSMFISFAWKNEDTDPFLMLYRDYAHFFIGKRGGITYPICIKGKQVCRRYKGMLKAICDRKDADERK